MAYESPDVIIYSSDGYEVTASNGTVVSANTKGFVHLGSDGTNIRIIKTATDGTLKVDPSGTTNQPVVGSGTDNSANSVLKLPVLAARANTVAPTWTDGNMVPLSVDTTGALRISGSITANNSSVSATGSAPPASATYIGASVTTSAPAYTTGQMSALSLTTAGDLRAVSKITDGTNAAAVKAASTSPAATDPALVVSLSSNSNVITSNTYGFKYSSYSPDLDNYPVTTQTDIAIDASSRLETHSTTTTDEGSLRYDFPGTSLTNAVGTLTFTNGSATVTGTGFLTNLNIDLYIKRDSDASTAWAKISRINSDTSLILANNYTGTSGASVSSSTIFPATTANGATVTVTGGNLVLATGTTNAASAYVMRQGDYLPYYMDIYGVAWSQNIANQEGIIGFVDHWPAPNKAAYIRFDGISNTQVTLVTQSGSAASEIETSIYSLPYGVTTANISKIQIDVEAPIVSLIINDVVIGQNKRHIPGPYDNLQQIIEVSNTAVAASTTSLTVDTIYFSNQNQISTKDYFYGTPDAVTLSGEDNIVRGKGSDGRLAVGVDTLMFRDTIEGVTINGTIWSQSQLTMTAAQAAGSLTLNNSAITTVNTYSILFSDKQCYISSEYTIDFIMRARLIHPGANAVIELGFGNVATTAVPTDGVFFRIDEAGILNGIISYGGVETSTAELLSLDSTRYYNFGIKITETGVFFEVTNSDDSIYTELSLAIPATQGSVTLNQHLPIFTRVYNSASAPATAPQILMSFVNVSQQDLVTNKDWASQLAGVNRNAIIDPVAYTQTCQLAAGAAPAAGAPTNATTKYTTLGGEFLCTSTASSENLLGVFGYLVPSPYNFVVTDIVMPQPFVTTTMGGGTASIHEWAIMFQANSRNPSTATGFRVPIGMFSAAATAAVGTVMNGLPLNVGLKTPLTVYGGQYILVLVKVISGTATGAYRGSIFINGYFE
jgi:hypothetical protein